MNGRLRTFLVRSGFLFLTPLVLVGGFWYPGEFYQIGFATLLLVGGLVTFRVIWAGRLALSGELPRGRPRGELTFSVEEGDRLLKAVARLVVRPSEGTTVPGVGRVVRAVYETGPEFGRLFIEDARRAFLSDITDADARQAGFRSAAELRETGATRWRWRSSDTVTVLQVRPLGRAIEHFECGDPRGGCSGCVVACLHRDSGPSTLAPGHVYGMQPGLPRSRRGLRRDERGCAGRPSRRYRVGHSTPLACADGDPRLGTHPWRSATATKIRCLSPPHSGPAAHVPRAN